MKGFKMATSELGSSLKEILTQDFLCCQICMDEFDTPKMLPCLHSYCLKCLSQYVKQTAPDLADAVFLCPTCRQEIQTPPGGLENFPTNFFIISLLDVMRSQKDTTKKCDTCLLDSTESEASSLCLDCNNYICKKCAEFHCKTKFTVNHQVVELTDDLSITVLKSKKEPTCQKHENKNLELFCIQCETPVCMKCIAQDHNKHELSEMETAAVERKEKITSGLDGLKEDVEELDKRLTSAVDTMDMIKERKEKIIQALEATEEKLKEEIHNQRLEIQQDFETKCKAEEKQILAEKDTDECKLGILQGTLDFAGKIVAHGKDVEILQLHKQISHRFGELILGVGRYHLTNIVQLNAMLLGFPLFLKRPQLLLEFNTKTENDINQPWLSGVAVSPSTRNIIVADHTNGKLMLYNNQGILIKSLKQLWHNMQPMTVKPFDVAILGKHIALAQYADKQILILDNDFKVQSYCTTAYNCTGITPLQNAEIMITTTVRTIWNKGNGIYKFNLINKNPPTPVLDTETSFKHTLWTEVEMPDYVLGLNNSFVVSDSSKDILHICDMEGNILHTYEGKDEDDPLSEPQGMCKDNHDNIIVADRKNRIHLVSQKGDFIAYLVTEKDGLEKPCAVTLNLDGDLVVTERSSGKVKVFKYQ